MGRNAAGDGRSDGSPRPYDMALRDAQVSDTRRRILEALIDMIGSGSDRPESVSVRAVAERAGVALATVYRHFKTKEAMFEAIAGITLEKFSGFPELPTLDSVPPAVQAMFAQMQKHEGFVRATLTTEYGREIRRTRRPDRDAMIASILAGVENEVSEDRYRALRVLVQLLTSPQAYLYLTDRGGYDADGAAEVASWAIRTLVTTEHSVCEQGRPGDRQEPPDDQVDRRA